MAIGVGELFIRIIISGYCTPRIFIYKMQLNTPKYGIESILLFQASSSIIPCMALIEHLLWMYTILFITLAQNSNPSFWAWIMCLARSIMVWLAYLAIPFSYGMYGSKVLCAMPLTSNNLGCVFSTVIGAQHLNVTLHLLFHQNLEFLKHSFLSLSRYTYIFFEKSSIKIKKQHAPFKANAWMDGSVWTIQNH